ncbi:atrial natriuretic peptide receptor 2-like [Physella acuta]|uniref:atrial natriuretic peptide receptor 2-like n=1 Tax=Physella acuta TaxID=109671 RepID=UPI0027DCEF8B|nr:atrial natriuretic peptide receptor 2-like [Physella acuta]
MLPLTRTLNTSLRPAPGLLTLLVLILLPVTSPARHAIGLLVLSTNASLGSGFETHGGQSLIATVEEAVRTTEVLLKPAGVKVTLTWRDAGVCDERLALGETVSLQRDQVDVIVGPFCPASLRVVALLGSFWKIPVVTWAPLNREVIEHSRRDDVMSTFGSFEDLARSAVVVMRHLRWTKIAILYDEDGVCEFLKEEILQFLQAGDHVTEAAVVRLRAGDLKPLTEGLRRVKQLTRTLVVCSQPITMETILQEAEVLDMTSGYYAFLYLNFDITPMAKVPSKKNSQRNLLATVLQLGHFPFPAIVATSSTQRRSGSSRDDLYIRTQMMLAPYLHDAILLSVMSSASRQLGRQLPALPTGQYLKTGPLEFDAHGTRRTNHSLLYSQSVVAMVTAEAELLQLGAIAWPNGPVPTSDLDCHFPGKICTDIVGVVAGVVVGGVLLVGVLIAAIFLYRKHRQQTVDGNKDWLVDDKDVKRRKVKAIGNMTFSNGNTCNGSTKKRLVRMETRGTLGLGSNCSLDKTMLYAPIGNYKDMVVAVKHVRWTHVQLSMKEMFQDLKTVKELSHDNVNQFIGAHVSSTPGSSYVLFRYCSKGSLQDVLENDDIKLNWMFKLSFALDLARGMEYIHKSPLRSHGNLKSSNCVIDSRWVLKITDFGAIVSYRKVGAEGDVDNRGYFNSLLWCAPEILRMHKRPHKGTQKADVFSFGIILQEILLRCSPYFYNNKDPEDIIRLVKSINHGRPYRPLVPNENDLPAKAFTLMALCWSEEPEARPDFHNIRKKLREFNGTKRLNIMDNMLHMLESYSSNLEQLVTDRTEELEAEKRKTDTLLYQMLPPLVAEQLKSGMSVIPEYFDHVSIFFSDIVGFTAIASQSRPLEVVDLLNDLYTCFDEVIARRDVYKVETIGDAYMCVSGCPKKNGTRHAGEIANMALDLISAVTHFRIRHKPEERLNLRVGLHTGPCAAGVVGRTMPRYCLFGDTVNMASRMESTGKALHIHMSNEMKEALDDLDWGFLMVERGFIEVKGKGLHKTFWLAGKTNYKKPLPQSLVDLQKSLEDGGHPPTPSYCTLTVGDSMFSALRKTSITVSNITMENTPYTSDSEDASSTHGPLSDASKLADMRSASAVISASSNVPKRRYATVAPVELVAKLNNQSDGTSWGKYKCEEADNMGNTNNETDTTETISYVKQAIKKDSACYSLSDNSSDPDLNRVDNSVGPWGSQNADFEYLPSLSGDNNENVSSVFGDTSQQLETVQKKRSVRKKYNDRRGVIDPHDIPRIEIT